MKNRKFTCKKCSRISTKSLLSIEDKKISPAATELCDFFLLCKQDNRYCDATPKKNDKKKGLPSKNSRKH